MKCEICGKYFKGPQSLSSHLNRVHNITDKKIYYDTYLKGNSGICPTCGKQTKYIDFSLGYKKYCSFACNPEYKDVEKFTCKLCNEDFIWKKDLCKHIKLYHKLDIKIYYDTYIKKEGEGICSVCKKPTKFNSLYGYKQYCSSTCQHKDPIFNEKIAQSTFEHYGVRNAFCLDRVKQHAKEKAWSKETRIKRDNTKLNRYGDKNYRNTDKIKQTLLEKYGYENPLQVPEIREKIKQTNLERYGEQFGQYGTKTFNKIMLDKYKVEYASQNEEFKNKIKQTNLERYGVVSPLSDSNWMAEATKKKYGISVVNQFNNPIDKTLSEDDL